MAFISAMEMFVRRLLKAIHLAPTGILVRQQGLTYLSAERMIRVRQELARLDRAGVPGEALEFGIALGGSAVFIARQVRGRRRFLGYDVFGMIPPPGENDPDAAHARYAEIATGASNGIKGGTYYGYRDNLMAEVSRRMAAYGVPVDGQNVVLIPGLYQETVPAALPQTVAFAHIDCDWHDPVAHVLNSLAPRLAPGAAIIIDDYNDHGGCRTATDAFLATHPEMELVSPAPNALLRRRHAAPGSLGAATHALASDG